MRHAAPSLLCLDLGTQTGWALYAEGKVVSGTYNLLEHPRESIGLRFLRFRKDFLSNFRSVREVHFEEVRRHEGTHAAHVYGGLWATLCAWCEEHAIPYSGVGVNVWKKSITGNGNAGKESVRDSIMNRGYHPADFNEADALAILLHVRLRDGI